MPTKSVLITLALLLTCQSYSGTTQAANILGVVTSFSPSHLIVHMAVYNSLAERGHNVTVVTCLEPKNAHTNINQLRIPVSEENQKILDEFMGQMSAEKTSFLQTLFKMLKSFNSLIKIQADMFRHASFQRLYEQKFDLLIVGYFMNDFALGVAAKFKAPQILSWSNDVNALISHFVGTPDEVSYVPNMDMAVKPGTSMSFLQRLQNYISNLLTKAFRAIITMQMQSIYSELFAQEDDFPSYQDMMKNVSVLFCNGHFSEGKIRPNVPAVVEIGGIQIKEKPNALPKNLADFLNNAKDGAILFSLGSNLKADTMKPAVIKAIYNVFSTLKQRVIMKWQDLSHVPGNASNILYSNWLPQDDILAHPNLKLFVTHAGKGGVVEAAYHGVPMLALPAFGDQHGNSEHIVAANYGQSIDIGKVTEANFRKAIMELLTNASYKQSVQTFSKLYRDRPLSAKQSVVYWSEYVMRHHGAAHMQSPLVHMNFIESSNMDVLLAIGLAVFVLWRVIKFVSVFGMRKLCGKSQKSAAKKASGKGKKKTQ